MNNAILNIIGDPRDSDPTHAFRRQKVHSPPKQRFKILCQLDKLEADWSLEFDDKIDVTCIVRLPFCIRAK